MGKESDLSNRINQKYAGMSKGQKRLAAYITDYYDQAVFLTAEKLGEAVGVSESTVVRFASSLGYKGYPGFQRALEIPFSVPYNPASCFCIVAVVKDKP